MMTWHRRQRSPTRWCCSPQRHLHVVAACLCSDRQRSSSPPAVAVGMVRQVGTPGTLASGTSSSSASSKRRCRSRHASSGGVLLDVVTGEPRHRDPRQDGKPPSRGRPRGRVRARPAGRRRGPELARSHRVVPGAGSASMCTDGTSGAAVASIIPGGPAQAAGIEPDDHRGAGGLPPCGRPRVADLQDAALHDVTGTGRASSWWSLARTPSSADGEALASSPGGG